MTNPSPNQRVRSAIVLIAVVGTFGLLQLAAASPSSAAGGVHFDPESPAGKEYALPLDEARNEATGNQEPEGTGPKSESSESAPLFGEGVSGGGTGTTGPEGESGRPEKGQESPGDENSQAPGPGKVSDAAGPLPQAGSAGYSALAGAGLVALIVLIGVGLGLALRGFQRARPT